MKRPVPILLHILLVTLIFFELYVSIQTSSLYQTSVVDTLRNVFLSEDIIDQEVSKEQFYIIDSTDVLLDQLIHSVDAFFNLSDSSLTLLEPSFVNGSISFPSLSFSPFSSPPYWRIPPNSLFDDKEILSILESVHSLDSSCSLLHSNVSEILLQILLQSSDSLVLSINLNHAQLFSTGAILNEWVMSQRFYLIKGSSSIKLFIEVFEISVHKSHSIDFLWSILFHRILINFLIFIISFILIFTNYYKPISAVFDLSREVQRIKKLSLLNSSEDLLLIDSLTEQPRVPCRNIKGTISYWFIFSLISYIFNIFGSVLDSLFVLNLLKLNGHYVYLVKSIGYMSSLMIVSGFFEKFDKFYLLITAVKRALPEAFMWVVSVFSILVGFSLFGFSLFGPNSTRLFGTVGQSFVTLFAAFNGDMVGEFYDSVYSSAPLFSRIYFYTFISIFTYCILNVFRVIIEHAYHTTELSVENQATSDELLTDFPLSKVSLQVDDQLARINEILLRNFQKELEKIQ
ncbi:hypothetical protein RCL1_006947 [Eukaryota sp. TZLM3-RCL]